MKNKQSIVILTLFLVTITLPVVWGWVFSNGLVFGGFVANPIDGQTYLAKMNEGFNGDWLFHLSFSPHAGDGQPLFLLYILLGHLSKLFNIPLIFVFHAARVLSALFLVYTLWILVNKCVSHSDVIQSWGLLLFGAGMGWVLLIFGSGVPIDFFVAEMYPFLASFTNPHFPLGLGILLWLFIGSYEFHPRWGFAFLFIGGILLSIILPFCIVLYACVYGIWFIWSWLKKENIHWIPILAVLSGGGLLLLYQYYVIRTDPVLSLWDSQNITPAPDILNLMMGMCPLILVVVLGYRGLIKESTNPYIRMLMVWLVVGILITYIPFNLQRRFLTGLYIPLGILAIIALKNFQIKKSSKTIIFRVVLSFVIISNLLLILMEIAALNRKESLLFLKQPEYNGLMWMRGHEDRHLVILASPELSLFIPGISGNQVVYGHPFETLNAESQKADVEKFYQGNMGVNEQAKFLTENQVKFVVYGPRERALGNIEIKPNWDPVYVENDFLVYEIQ
jgi:hypothetical protein